MRTGRSIASASFSATGFVAGLPLGYRGEDAIRVTGVNEDTPKA